MSKHGPIILIEDDADDASVFEDLMATINPPNKLIWFSDALKALDYLQESVMAPFIIVCDINMPKCNGIRLKGIIDENPSLRKKSIPFIFYSTSSNQPLVDEAYTQLTVQGFFKKENSYEAMKQMLEKIFDYWKLSLRPDGLANL